jgi:concanavalin A-like lectin/glucanase superfamily protein
MKGTLARCLLFACLGGCVFDPRLHASQGEGDDNGSGGSNDPVTRCHVADGVRADLRLCIDFEDPAPMEVAHDTSGWDHDASVSGTIDMEPRITGEQAAKFTFGSLHIDDTDDLDFSTQLTVEMFVALTAYPLKTQRFTLLDNAGQYTVTIEDNLEVRCSLSGDRHISSGTKVRPVKLAQLNRWYHIGCTFDGQSLQVFVDGDTSDCESQDKPIMDFVGPTTIGARMGTLETEFLVGALDNVHVYSRALSHTEMCEASGRTAAQCNLACPMGPDSGD